MSLIVEEAAMRQAEADRTALDTFRQEFPEFIEQERERPLVHLASCSCGPTPQRVLKALERFAEEKRQHGAQWEGWYQEYVFPAHERCAQLYQVETSQVAMMANVSTTLAAIAGCFHETARRTRFAGRNQIVLYRDDFPTIGDVFLHSQPLGLEVVLSDQETEEIAPKLNHQTLLVALSHVSYLTGQRRNLAHLARQVHEAGALILVDDSQSAGTFPLNFNTLGLDLLVTGSSKYLLAGEGASAWLIVSERLLEQLEPLGAGWAADTRFRLMCDPETHHDTAALWDSTQFAFAQDAWRFATGTAPIKAALEASVAFQLLLETGLERIQRQIARQVNSLLGACHELQLPLMSNLPRPQGPMVALRAASPAHAEELASMLRQRRIWTSARGPAVRLAPHGFTTNADIGWVWPVLSEHRRWLDV